MTTPYWLLGLPFDAVTLEDARRQVFAAAESRQQLVLATPNVNFLAMASRDATFRADVLKAGLSTADGMPVIWIGRMLGIPFKGRVAGSDLLESLLTRPGPRPLRVFFFGGDEGTADAAMQAVNLRGGGLAAVGAWYPGYAGITEMSSDSIINTINQSNADVLVLALGAAKGHRWMEANRHRLKVPVLCHLGAAVNFIAGRLRRAPPALQKLGLEWLWRIKEEPALYARYARDGLFLLQSVVKFALPEWVRQRFARHGRAAMEISSDGQGRVTASVRGRFGEAEIAALASLDVAELALERVSLLDAAGVGWLYAQRYRRREAFTLACDASSRRALSFWRAEVLLERKS